MKEWWQRGNFFLKVNNSRERDPLWKTLEEVRHKPIAKILDQRKSEIDELIIKYKESAITELKWQMQSHKPVLIFAPGRSTTLTAAKIHQMLGDTRHVILNLQQLIRSKPEVILAWKSVFHVLVIESDDPAEVVPEVFNELSDFLNKNVEKKYIFISNSLINIQQLHALQSAFPTNLIEVLDDCKFMDVNSHSLGCYFWRRQLTSKV
jgi:hypothetical protein